MEPSTIEDLKRESAFRRKRAKTDIEVADKIDQIVDALVDDIVSKGVLSPSEFRMGRERQERVTQADILETTLRMHGKPLPLEMIADHAYKLDPPLKVTNLENLRSVMSRDGRFRSFGGGVWGLKSFPLLETSKSVTRQPDLPADNPLLRPGPSRAHTDLTAGEQHQNGGEA